MKNPSIIIYYDGCCILCSRAMNFSIRHDLKKIIYYSPIQSDYAKRNLEKIYIDDMNTVVVKKDNNTFTKSKAAFVVLDTLQHPLRYLQYILPTFIADKFYYFIAERRYKWFGKREACSFPNDNSQFLIK